MSAKLNHISITEIKRLINEETELLCMYSTTKKNIIRSTSLKYARSHTKHTQQTLTIAKRKSVNRQRAGKWWEMCQSYIVRLSWELCCAVQGSAVLRCVERTSVYGPIATAFNMMEQEIPTKEATKVQRNGPTTHSNHHETAWKQKKKPIGMLVERPLNTNKFIYTRKL